MSTKVDECALSSRRSDAPLAWLSQFALHARDQESPLGSFLAALPRPPKRRAKSSSERGRAFRARQRDHEKELEGCVAALQREIAALDTRRLAWDARALHSPVSVTGSYVQTIREYHRLFARGLVELPTGHGAVQKRAKFADDILRHVQRQEDFIRCVFDPSAVVGNEVGPEASLVQWRRYTKSHASIIAETQRVEILDSGENTLVTAHCVLRVRFSLDTFRMVFPHALRNAPLVAKFVGMEIVYPFAKHFEFSPSGRIIRETADVGFVEGLLRCGCTMLDVAELMMAPAVSADSMIIEDVKEEYDAPAKYKHKSETPAHAPKYDEPVPAHARIYVPEDNLPSREALHAEGPLVDRQPKRLSMAFLLSSDALAA